MATSGSYSFVVSQSDIIYEALLNNATLGEGEVPTSQEYSDSARKLNMIIKQWMGRFDFAPGLKMWTRTRADLFLGYYLHNYRLGPTGDNWAGGVTGGTWSQNYNSTTTTAVSIQGATSLTVDSITNINANDYIGVVTTGSANDLFWTTVVGTPSSPTVNLAAPLNFQANSGAQIFNYTTKAQRPLMIETALLRDIYANDTPLDVLTLQDYELLPTKTSDTYQADPTSFYYESQIGTPPSIPATAYGTFRIQCGGAQDVTKHIHAVFLSPVQDINNPGDNPALPQQWYMPLCWELAKQTAPMFDAIWTPEMEQNRMYAIAMAKEADAETTSFYFQRDAGSPYEP